MHSVFFDAKVDDATRRARLYDGQLFVYSPRPNTVALCAFARELTEAAFAPFDPRDAQYHLPVDEYVAILARLKPQFINHPHSKELLQGVLREFGCDPAATYFDVPRLRTMVHGDYLRAGLAYQFHPHRDTWFSAPSSQINWWLPIYEIEPIPQLRLLCDVGGTILFSAAQMHSTVDNTSGRTRFSIDFRTVHRDDVLARRGANNIDSDCTGTTLRDYLRGTDFARLPEEVVAPFDTPLVAV